MTTTAHLAAADLMAQPFGSHPEEIAAHARERPDHLALVEGARRPTYAQLDALTDRIAAALPAGVAAQRINGRVGKVLKRELREAYLLEKPPA